MLTFSVHHKSPAKLPGHVPIIEGYRHHHSHCHFQLAHSSRIIKKEKDILKHLNIHSAQRILATTLDNRSKHRWKLKRQLEQF